MHADAETIMKGGDRFQVEYTGTGQCTWMNAYPINSMRRNFDLTAGGIRTPCTPDTQVTW